MPWLVDVVYLTLGLLTSPVWLFRMIRTGKIRTDWRGRFGRARFLPRTPHRPRILFHAVSVGEVNAIRLLIETLAASAAKPELVIAATTDTGFARASSLWDASHQVVRYPFDFSWAAGRFLHAVQPDLVVLVELEVWPNFTAICHRRGIPLVVVNGRLTARSFKRYRLVSGLIRPMFRRLACIGAQNQDIADRFASVGAQAVNVHVTGTMKWDTAQIADVVPGADQLASELGIDRQRPLVVVGSAAPEEIALAKDAVPEGAQLLCAPRKPEWFDQAAAELPGCVRRTVKRSNPQREFTASRSSDASAKNLSRYFLLDTIGELRQAYALADIVIVGRSFGKLHGSDLIEPVALGKPVVIGPAVADFKDAVDALLAGDGIIQTTAALLPSVIQDLLSNPTRRRELAAKGRAVIRSQQGATERNAALILKMLDKAQQVRSKMRQ